MFRHLEIQNLDDYFRPLNERENPGVYFYRMNGYSDDAARFIRAYFEEARKNGVIIEGRLQNPDEKNLAYYHEVMGMYFEMDTGFLTASLKKWLPRMNDHQREHVALSLYDALFLLQKAGKTEYMLKNAYIKCMCWLYYKFERIVNRLGENQIPKILYEGDISYYELMLLSILSNAGCDVLLLQYNGDANYLKSDAASKLSFELKLPGMKAFPQDFSLKKIREEIKNEADLERLYGPGPSRTNCTNAWLTAAAGESARGAAADSLQASVFSDIRKSALQRGGDTRFYYNCFCRIHGVWDKVLYASDLYQFHLELKNSGRKTVIVNEGIERPSMEEIASVHRSHYTKTDQLIQDLSSNLNYTADMQLQRIMKKAFVDVIRMEASAETNLNRLTSQAVYLICWLKRYQGRLFADWKEQNAGCFIYMGGCRDANEALFLKFLARLPADVLILCPDLKKKCCLSDRLLYEINYTESLDIRQFPEENTNVRLATAAYQAERELDTLMYQDSGIYRERQFEKAHTVTLKTMYEEIRILWQEEVKYRPNFSTVENEAHIPVIFAKISGVKDGDLQQYWRGIRELVTEDTFVIKKAPYLEHGAPNPIRAHAAEFYKNGRLRRDKIKASSDYQYAFLREEIQDYILDKLQLLIEQKTIRGTFVNGTEYTVIATVLNLPKEIVRLIQKFDFTKKNPKLIYINTTEEIISLEDTILTAFLNRIGFDVLFFVPTGYQNIEKHFNGKMAEEHQAGEYMYDLKVPDLAGVPGRTLIKWRDRLFKRGK